MQFKIGSVAVKNLLVLAPMYRISDLAFRILCRESGAGLCFSEMVNSEALIRNNKSNWLLTKTIPEDTPLGMQLFGARVESMRKAASLLIEKNRFEILDLNLGCPSHGILNQGAGAALLKRPQRISEILESWRDLGKPVTAKIRVSPNMLHTIKLAKTIEKSGASALIVHGRTIEQAHKGKTDFVAIKRIKKSLGIPVIGNGGVKDRESLELMLDKTKCDAVMVGTAAIGNPGIFSELLGKKPVAREKALFQYLALCKEFGVPRFGRIKTQSLAFLKHGKHTELKQKISSAKNLAELEAMLNKGLLN
ncbi:MAG: tRNA-dihydrouridine synthase family protein [Candidatus Diapherotrites archaeon]|nr:tRNA-dihydrouridine synthase family protein [Candidatus Diapherotrites archaeon]